MKLGLPQTVCNNGFQPIDWSETSCMTTALTTADLTTNGTTTPNLYIERCDDAGIPIAANLTVSVHDPTDVLRQIPH